MTTDRDKPDRDTTDRDKPDRDTTDRDTTDRDKPDRDKPDRVVFRIRIDRVDYTVTEEKLDGEQVRQVPSPPIPQDRDLYLVVPGHDDRKIKDDDTVEMRDGLRFFTAPNTINPGMASASDSPG